MDQQQQQTLRGGSVTLADLPSELVYIVARLAPVEVLLLARANRTLWARFASDRFMWAEHVRFLHGSDEGRAMLRRHAVAVLDKFPALMHVMPVPVTPRASYFDISPSGEIVACGKRICLKVLARSSRYRQLATFDHDEDIKQLRFSPSGSLLTCLGRHNIVLYDCHTWKRLGVFALDNMCFFSVAFCSDQLIVAGADNGQIVLWNAPHGLLSRVISHEDAREGARVSVLAASRTMFASGRLDGVVELWSSAGQRQFQLTNQRDDTVSDLCFDANGSFLVASTFEGAVRVWTTATAEMTHQFHFATTLLTSIALARTGVLAVALSDRDEVHFVSLANGCLVRMVPLEASWKVRFAPDAPSMRESSVVVFISENTGTFSLYRMTL